MARIKQTPRISNRSSAQAASPSESTSGDNDSAQAKKRNKEASIVESKRASSSSSSSTATIAKPTPVSADATLTDPSACSSPKKPMESLTGNDKVAFNEPSPPPAPLSSPTVVPCPSLKEPKQGNNDDSKQPQSKSLDTSIHTKESDLKDNSSKAVLNTSSTSPPSRRPNKRKLSYSANKTKSSSQQGSDPALSSSSFSNNARKFKQTNSSASTTSTITSTSAHHTPKKGRRHGPNTRGSKRGDIGLCGSSPASASTTGTQTQGKKGDGKQLNDSERYDAALGEAHDLLGAAAEAQALGRLKMATGYMLLLHTRLLSLGKVFDRERFFDPPTVDTTTSTPTPAPVARPSSTPTEKHTYEGIGPIINAATSSRWTSKEKDEDILHRAKGAFQTTNNTATTTDMSPSAKVPMSAVTSWTSSAGPRPLTPSLPPLPSKLLQGEKTASQNRTVTMMTPTVPIGSGPVTTHEPSQMQTKTSSPMPPRTSTLKPTSQAQPEQTLRTQPQAIDDVSQSTTPTSTDVAPPPRPPVTNAPLLAAESAALLLSRSLPKDIQLDTTMMEHLARAAIELHNQRIRTGNTLKQPDTTSTVEHSKEHSKTKEDNSEADLNHDKDNPPQAVATDEQKESVSSAPALEHQNRTIVTDT